MHFVTRVGRDGKPLFNQQMVQLKLSEMHMLTEALRSFMLRIAWERDQAVADDAFYRKSANNMLALNSPPMRCNA